MRIRAAYILDMIAHNNDRVRDVFQIAPGEGAASAHLAAARARGEPPLEPGLRRVENRPRIAGTCIAPPARQAMTKVSGWLLEHSEQMRSVSTTF